MTTAYQATFEDARKSLATLCALPGHCFLSDDVETALLPVLSSYKDTTDAHLMTLAKRQGLKLATLDETLLGKSKGRVASLLEVGAGFHTGPTDTFLNPAWTLQCRPFGV